MDIVFLVGMAALYGVVALLVKGLQRLEKSAGGKS